MLEIVSKTLKLVPFFAELSDDTILALAQKAVPVEFSKQTTIISEGEQTNSLYVIVSGKVRVFSSFDDSKEITLLIEESGAYFGEISLLTDEPRSASVMTLEDTLCGMISKADFIDWLNLHPNVAINLLSVLSEKVRYLTEKVKQMALSSAYLRTMQVLQSMAQLEDTIFIIPHKPTDQELANMVGASREMINKILTELTREGYIEMMDSSIHILKKLSVSW